MTRLDLLPNGYKIFQDPAAFCFGADAQLLCSFAKVKRGCAAIDLGCGNGIIPFLLHKKSLSLRSSHAAGPCRFTGLEIQEQAAELAQKSVALNGLEKSIDIIQGDIKNVKKLFQPQSFDVVLSNPPYMKVQGSRENADERKRIARHEIFCTVNDVAAAASYLIKTNGTFFMVHRPYRLQEIFDAFEKHKLVARRARLVYPAADKAPEMILIEARKNCAKDLKFEPPLVMYQGRDYTKEFLDYISD
ncbi:MAG: tRNA1(Val) (adenine(37)-N6)-methyltransferase [Treponema sp.]|nr:tRNA1(Val) (adenine(37)-N6)-methyltransferase [Treponema sp.]